MQQRAELKMFQIIDLEQLENAFYAGLIERYQEIFAEPPYFEQFSDNEVRELFTAYTVEGLVFLIQDDPAIVGFGAVLPFVKSPVAYLGERFGIDPEHTWYMTELGIKREYRKRGLACQLVQAILNLLTSDNTVILRTSERNIAAQSLYSGLGFQTISVTENVSQQRQDGTIQIDKRIFMIKIVALDNESLYR